MAEGDAQGSFASTNGTSLNNLNGNVVAASEAGHAAPATPASAFDDAQQQTGADAGVLTLQRAHQMERPLLPKKEERLRGDILELRAEVAAARGRYEQSQRQAIAQASGHATTGRETRVALWTYA